ncbi:MAG: chemotaxis protein CheW [Vicinamibacteria bacterium]
MTRGDGFVTARALQLRGDFDRSFATAERAERAEFTDVLAVRIATQGYALRASDLAGLFKARAVTPIPSPRPELLGLAGLRGRVVPVYDLRLLLGHPRGERPRWLVLAAGPEALALAFDDFEGQFRVAREDLTGAGPRTAPKPDGQAVRTGDVLRRILDVPSLVEAIKAARGEDPSKER